MMTSDQATNIDNRSDMLSCNIGKLSAAVFQFVYRIAGFPTVLMTLRTQAKVAPLSLTKMYLFKTTVKKTYRPVFKMFRSLE
jgi:hypothetical protein